MKKILVILFAFALMSIGIIYAQESVEQYLLNLREPKEEDYIKLLYEGSQENKVLAAKKLAELGTDNVAILDALVFGLQQGTVFVKREGGKVTNDFWDVRATSANALGNIKNERVLPDLYTALRYDRDNYVKSEVALAIGKIGKRESIYELSRTIEISNNSGSDDILIRACVEAIGEIGHRDGFVPLVEVMRGNYTRRIKLAARESLKKIRW